WLLLGYSHLRKELRPLRPSRILEVKTTGKTFPLQRKFCLEKRLRDSFGVITGQGEFDVLIRFDETISDYIREKRWHPSQQLTEIEDGSIELRLKLSRDRKIFVVGNDVVLLAGLYILC